MLFVSCRYSNLCSIISVRDKPIWTGNDGEGFGGRRLAGKTGDGLSHPGCRSERCMGTDHALSSLLQCKWLQQCAGKGNRGGWFIQIAWPNEGILQKENKFVEEHLPDKPNGAKTADKDQYRIQKWHAKAMCIDFLNLESTNLK